MERKKHFLKRKKKEKKRKRARERHKIEEVK